MKAPPCVRAVLDKPGTYLFRGPFTAWFFEVDERGRCYQLTPDSLERDGLLSADGWLPSSLDGRVTPLSSGEIP